MPPKFFMKTMKIKKTTWFRGNTSPVYHKLHFDKSYIIQKVKIKFNID